MWEILSRLFGTFERPSPSDIVPHSNIRHDIGANLILISLGGLNIPFALPPQVWISAMPDTNSMDPVFDFTHSVILIAGADKTDHKKLLDFLKVGDIAVYKVDELKFSIIHRIVKIGNDSKGRYFRFQGDNNAVKDPYNVRDSQVLFLCIGTIF